MKKLAVLFPVLAASVAGAFAQQQGTLAFDTSGMNVSVVTDQAVYLPGETARITLTVSNPANRPVVNLVPFLSSTSCLSLAVKGGPPPRLEAVCGSAPTDETNTMTFGPGETKEIVLHSYNLLFDIGQGVLEGGSAPTRPGNYVVYFRYGASASAEVEFPVAPTKLEADAMARVHDVLYSADPEATRLPYPDYVHVLALRSNGVSYVCVQQGTISSPEHVLRKVDVRNNVDFDDSHTQIGLATGFKRVATSAASIVSLSATADAQENLTIDWTDANGGQGHLFYPASYPARPPDRNQ